jgi:hypothetical protein
MRKHDIIYTDILLKDIELYIGMDDEECHKLESVVVEQRYDIKVWLKKEF